MNPTAPDFVTVDMRGLKAALVARAQAQRVSVSALVRGAVARELGVEEGEGQGEPAGGRGAIPRATPVKLSIRMTADEAQQLAAGARAAGLSRGAYLAGLIAGVPALSAGSSRTDHIAALRASTAELSTLSRNIHRLTALLRQADVAAARPYREVLESVAADVRRHLELAAGVLADLQPRPRTTPPAAGGDPASSRRTP
jgi:hypothetical protein